MATTINETPFVEHRVTERRRHAGTTTSHAEAGNAYRVSWAGIWAGVLAALGTLLLLATLGIAIGVTAVDFQNPDAGALGMGAAIWTGLTLLIAMFVGGMVSTRLGMITDRTTGLYEGGLVWVLATVLILYLAGSGLGALVGGAMNLAGTATRGVSAVTGGVDLNFSQMSVDQMVARLQDPDTARSIATATGIPADEVRASLNQTAQAIQDVREDPAAAAAEARRGMADLMARAQPVERLEQAGQTSAWATFISLLLSLGAAVGGAAVGLRNSAKHLRHDPAPTA